MHDPMTVAFEIKYPWKEGVSEMFPTGFRDTFLTLWHVDPEKDGTDSSCQNGKPFRWTGWRLHFWHWRIQINPLQDLKRWLFSRCADCQKRFRWGYAPISRNWSGTGPRWFRREESVYHHECAGSSPAKN